MKLVRLNAAMILTLPKRGMPIMLGGLWSSTDDDSMGWEAVVDRSNRVNGMDMAVPSAVYLPTGGMGFFGWPAIQGHRCGRQFILHPSDWHAEEDRFNLILNGQDATAEIALRLEFRLGEGNVVCMRTRVTNFGATPYFMDRCMAGTLLIDNGADSVTVLTGGWGREFHERTETLGTGTWLQESRRGRTSHDRSPTIEVHGGDLHYGIHLGWSGNHVVAIDRIDDGRSLLHAGELFESGETILEPGAHYESPILYAHRHLSASQRERSRSFHQIVRHGILKWPGGAMKPRPVMLNTWEGTYFDHRIEKLKAQATAAKELGIERFVLDDGWFGRRDSDNAALGDWFVDVRKYPEGLNQLIDHVNGLGLEFGIWIEPEMVNPDSELYRAHPDWVLQVKGKPLVLSRNQLVLDLTRREVFDHLWSRLDWLLGSHAISYLKWDMNRDLTHAGDELGRPATARQTRSVYALMDKVRAAYPEVEIESCASGGGRADYGILERTHRVWVSDCTDALERLPIQQGARRFLPPEIMGCHISASPNHQTHRTSSLSFRAIVAFFGHLGIELDPTSLSLDERTELKTWISLHKELRSILHHPDGVSFGSGPNDGRYVFGVHLRNRNSDGEHVITAVAQAIHPLCEQPKPIAFPIHCSENHFVVRRIGPGSVPFVRSVASQRELLAGRIVSGNWINSYGLPIPQLYPESAILLEIKTVEAKHG